jgi:hypothetical protein
MSGLRINQLTAGAAVSGSDILPAWQSSTVGITVTQLLTYFNANATLDETTGGTGQTGYTAGDILYAFNPTTLAKRGIGSTGQVLSVSGGLPTWAYPGSVVNSQSADYTFALTDQGGRVYHPVSDTSARTWTIPANASVAFPTDTVIALVNDVGAGAITIAITSDTLIWSPTGGTGSRTLAAAGVATLQKVTSTRWFITGTGLT